MTYIKAGEVKDMIDTMPAEPLMPQQFRAWQSVIMTKLDSDFKRVDAFIAKLEDHIANIQDESIVKAEIKSAEMSLKKFVAKSVSEISFGEIENRLAALEEAIAGSEESAADAYRKHVFNRNYMSGVERDTLRVKQTAEVFTPDNLVAEMIDALEDSDPTMFVDPTRTFFEPSAGDGQFLVEVICRKMERGGVDLYGALSTVYAIELMPDNVTELKRRLAGPSPSKRVLNLLDRQILCGNSLDYDPDKEWGEQVLRDAKETFSK